MVGLTVDCSVTRSKIGLFGLGVLRFGCIGEIICCAVVTTNLHLWDVMMFEYLVV